MRITWACRRCCLQKFLAVVMILFSLSIPLDVLVPLSAPAAAEPLQKVVGREPSQQEVDQMLSIAEQQFEIVKILIKQGRFEQVLPEMKKIYDLNLPDKYEQPTAESASLAANLLIEHKQFEVAHQILDAAFGRMRRCDNRAAVLKVNAYVYKSEGSLDKARETFARAVEIERQCGSSLTPNR